METQTLLTSTPSKREVYSLTAASPLLLTFSTIGVTCVHVQGRLHGLEYTTADHGVCSLTCCKSLTVSRMELKSILGRAVSASRSAVLNSLAV